MLTENNDRRTCAPNCWSAAPTSVSPRLWCSATTPRETASAARQVALAARPPGGGSWLSHARTPHATTACSSSEPIDKADVFETDSGRNIQPAR